MPRVRPALKRLEAVCERIAGFEEWVINTSKCGVNEVLKKKGALNDGF